MFKVDNERIEHFYDYAINVHKFNSNALLSKLKTSQKSIETTISQHVSIGCLQSNKGNEASSRRKLNQSMVMPSRNNKAATIDQRVFSININQLKSRLSPI